MLLDSELSKIVRESFPDFSDNMEVKDLVPIVLKSLRQKEGLSVQEVADRLGFKSRSSYFKYEAGERSISIDQFSRIVTAITGKSLVIKLKSFS